MGPTWGPPGSCRPQMGPMLAPWTLLSGYLFSPSKFVSNSKMCKQTVKDMLSNKLTMLSKFKKAFSVQRQVNYVACMLIAAIDFTGSVYNMSQGLSRFGLHIPHKNIERHTAHTIVSWPNPKQWVMVHTSDLMMMIRQSMYILSIIIKEMGKLKTDSLTYCIMDNWENMLNLTHYREI